MTNHKINKIVFNARPFSQAGLRGLSRHTFNLVKEIHILKPEIEIHLFCRGKIHAYFKELLPFAIFHEHDGRIKIFWDLIILPRLLKKHRIDLYHSTNNLGVPFIFSIPIILTIHDAITHQHRFPLKLKHWWDGLNYRIEYLLLKKASIIITVSEDAKKQIVQEMKVNASKIKVIYNGTNLVNNTNNQREGFYLYVGGLDPRKNIEVLIDALNDISKKNSFLKLVMVSDLNSANERLKDKIKNARFKIEILKNISDEKLSELYSKAKMVIIPSLEEGFGLPVAEAMALKAPLLVSDIPIFREVTNGFSYFFSPLKTNDLIQFLEEVELKTIDLNKNVDEAFAFSKKYSWSYMAYSTLNIYELILNHFKKHK